MFINVFRTSGTTRSGSSFAANTIQAVWEKAIIVPGYDSRVVRKDRCEAWIKRNQYGKTTEYGWEIDHIIPVSQGGSDELDNLQPLYWRNNRAKGDNYPAWYCAYGE